VVARSRIYSKLTGWSAQKDRALVFRNRELLVTLATRASSTLGVESGLLDRLAKLRLTIEVPRISAAETEDKWK
jgi:hypothetical protein